jgi:hypothetical protein
VAAGAEEQHGDMPRLLHGPQAEEKLQSGEIPGVLAQDAARLRVVVHVVGAGLRGVSEHVGCVVLGDALLRERLDTRRVEGRDPSEANESVLALQYATREPLTEAERACTVMADMTREPDLDDILARLAALERSLPCCFSGGG